MVTLMKIAIVAAGACLVAAFTAPSAENRLKDRAAMMVYDGRDRVIALMPYADSANLTLILTQIQGDSVTRQQLANRSCVGLALFSKWEWSILTAGGRKPSDIRPSEASIRFRLYPATKDARAAVEDIRDGKAYVALGFEWAENPPPPAPGKPATQPIKWSIPGYAARAQGPCTAE
jgi:hypothetical protein